MQGETGWAYDFIEEMSNFLNLLWGHIVKIKKEIKKKGTEVIQILYGILVKNHIV